MEPQKPIELIPASCYSFEFLTELFNQTRSGYLIPMSMQVDQFKNYLSLYDVDVNHSWVAKSGSKEIGLAMLGVRPGRTWLTRLGVLQEARHSGAGEILLRALLESTRKLGIQRAILEVIQGNQPAERLFARLGCQKTQSLLILRKPAGPVPDLAKMVSRVNWFGLDAAVEFLSEHLQGLPWINQPETFANAGDGQMLDIQLSSGEKARLIFRQHEDQLSHFVFFADSPDGKDAGNCLLGLLHQQFPDKEAFIENVPADSSFLPSLIQAGYQIEFRRTEMNYFLPPDENEEHGLLRP